MPRKIPPPDFRYVWLMPGPTGAALALGVGTVGFGAFGIWLLGAGHHPLALSIGLTGGTIVALSLARAEEQRHQGARQVAMAIVPWGVLVEPDTEPRVLHWPAVKKIGVQVAHTMQGGTPAVVSSFVTVHIEREVLAGRTPGPAGLEGLTVHLEAYASEAARPVSSDLDGFAPFSDGAAEPVMAELLRSASELCGTAQGAIELGLPPGGYRTVASLSASPETIALLRRILTSGIDAEPPGDPRPLAAIVAARLGARELVPDLLRLSNAPHPVVAAVARAAALRLGAARNRTGAIEEVGAFLRGQDREQIAAWAEEGAVAR